MSINPTSSIEIWCAESIRQLVETMARQRVFRGADNVILDPLEPQHVILRAYRSPGQDETRRTGERLVGSPCCIVTYTGHRRPPSAGENCVDDGLLNVIVQICDDADEPSVDRLPTYLAWLEDIRRRVLRKPGSHLSPLESMPIALGQIYLVHVSENKSPDETDWSYHEKMRAAIVVQCYTRTSR